MSTNQTCRAVKRDGQRCSRRSQIAGFCRLHYPKPARTIEETLRERIKTAGQIIAVAGGALKLIEVLVQVWQRLPFGPGPVMPPDYHYLERKLGPSPPPLSRRGVHRPFMKGPNSVNWQLAREIHDISIGALAQITAEGSHIGAREQEADGARIEAAVVALLDTMEFMMREQVLEAVGDVDESAAEHDGVA